MKTVWVLHKGCRDSCSDWSSDGDWFDAVIFESREAAFFYIDRFVAAHWVDRFGFGTFPDSAEDAREEFFTDNDFGDGGNDFYDLREMPVCNADGPIQEAK